MSEVGSPKKKSNEFVQRVLFDTESKPSSEPGAKPIDDGKRDQILETLLALSSINGLGFATLQTLFDRELLQPLDALDVKSITPFLPSRHGNLIVDEIISNRRKLQEHGRQLMNDLREQQIGFFPRAHASFPDSLLKLPESPRWIFVKGNTKILRSDVIIGVVGTRSASPDGLRLAYRFAKELVNRNVIVLSGLAKGIDEQAHLGAVDNLGQTIAILGHGLNAAQTKSSRSLILRIIDNNGAVVSEYLPFELPSRNRYLRRNELQVAISQLIVPVECPTLESGTGSTIRRAMKIGTEVIGIVPKDFKSETLVATQENLEKLNHRVFTVLGYNSIELWNYLKAKFPNHDWSIDLQKRRDKFLQQIEQEILAAKEALELDEDAIIAFVEKLKLKLRKN